MKKYSLILVTLLLSAPLFMSCSDKDDKVTEENGYLVDRLMTPVFRLQQNNYSGVKGSDDPYGCGYAKLFENCPSNHTNDMWLNWYTVDGAIAYQIQARIGVGGWDEKDNTAIVLDTIIPAIDEKGNPVHSFLHEDLAYNQAYLYAIRAISPKGEEYNSKWYGKQKDLSHQAEMSRDAGASTGDPNYGAMYTGDRYNYPKITWVTDVTENSVRINFNTEIGSGIDITKEYGEYIASGGQTDEKKENWIIDEIRIVPTADNPDLDPINYKLTETDLANGYVSFDGLISNASYNVIILNTNIKRYYDSEFDKINFRMHGQKGEPITIKANQPAQDRDTLLTMAYVPELAGKITRLDTVLINYMSDNTISEGQIFYLEGGQTYYMQSTIDMTKGFTLETDPADIAAGKGRATIFMGVGFSDENKKSPRSCNFNISRPAKSATENGMMFTIDDIIFNNINFRPYAYARWTDDNKTKGTGNYFINMNSSGLSFSLNKLQISNCTMDGLVRGFVRFQGSNQQIIGALHVDNCVFFDCGNYDNKGEGYAWFDGPGKNRLSNFFQDFKLTNCTFVDSPRRALVNEAGNLAYPKSTKWNFTIENNTFINYSTRTTTKTRGILFETPYPPKGSHFTVKKNLFVWTRKGDADKRDFNMKGAYIMSSLVSHDFADNYSTYVPAWGKNTASDDPKTKLLDGMFTLRPFSDDQEGAGQLGGTLNVGGMNELRIKFGDNRNDNEPDAVGYQIKAEELCKDPQPLGVKDDKDMHRHNVDGFYYNNTDRVKNHPIYTKKIGDQRWATGAAWK